MIRKRGSVLYLGMAIEFTIVMDLSSGLAPRIFPSMDQLVTARRKGGSRNFGPL